MQVLAIIPARGGSKGIPKKNLAILLGKPLIDYSIMAATESEVINRVVVSSEDDEIIRHCRDLSIEVIRRPASLADDYTQTEPVIMHALNVLENSECYVPDWIVLLQPTSPLRSAKDIDTAYQSILQEGANGAISVTIPSKSPYKALTIDSEGRLRGLVSDDAPFMPRQKCPPVYYPNGAVYIIRSKDFKIKQCFELADMVPYLMSKERSIDIDNPKDILKAEYLMRKNNE